MKSWIGKTGLPASVEAELIDYLRRELGEVGGEV